MPDFAPAVIYKDINPAFIRQDDAALVKDDGGHCQ